MSSADPDELIAAWRKTYGELNPHRNPKQMPVDDATFALGLTLSRQIAAANRAGSLADLKERDIERIAKRNLKAPE